jgi:GNAT superfamily N-acetyltransferase
MLITRKARPEDHRKVVTFYRAHDYTPAIGRGDLIVVAEREGALCAAVRLCEEHGTLVLRGMRVVEGQRRRGIGTDLLKAAVLQIGDRECFCIAHRSLRSFYARVGFGEIKATEAPAFLHRRCSGYRREFGLDVIILRRAGTVSERQSGGAGEAEREQGE